MDCPDYQALEEIADRSEHSPELTEHLSTCDACRQRLEEVRANLALSESLTRAGGLTDVPGDQLPPDLSERGYRVIRELFRGGQGTVYLCEHGPTRRRVAVKTLLRGSLSSRRRRMRFEREAELVAKLRHPNVVTVYDSGVSDDGQAFIAMEYIEGGPLSVDGPPPRTRSEEQRVVGLFVRVCEGVAAAHRRGVIHRDLKPSNILLDSDGSPHVLDFGVAKAMDETDSDQTAQGEFVGTLSYAAPEQLTGGGDEIDARTDIYSLGLILFELLSGTRARDRDLPFGSMLELVRSGKVPRAGSVNPHLSQDLDAIVQRALAPEPGERYRTVEALREDLERFVEGRPVEAMSGRRWYAAKKLVRRHWVPIGVAAAFVLVLVLASVVSFTQKRAAELQAAKANSIRLFLEDTLASVDPESPEVEPTIRDTLDEAVHWVEIALADQPEVAASIRGTIGNSYRAIGRLDDAEVQITLALDIRKRLLGPNHPDLAQSLNQLGLLRRDQGRLDEAQALMRRALTIRADRYGAEHPITAMSLMNLGGLALLNQKPAEAAELFTHALEIRSETHRGQPHSDVAMCLFRLGEAAELDGRLDDAIDLHQRALDMRRDVLHELHPDLARSLFDRGRLGVLQQEPGVSPLLEESVGLLSRRLGENHWRVGVARLWLARALIAGGRSEEGLEQVGIALDVLNAALDPDDPLIAEAHEVISTTQ